VTNAAAVAPPSDGESAALMSALPGATPVTLKFEADSPRNDDGDGTVAMPGFDEESDTVVSATTLPIRLHRERRRVADGHVRLRGKMLSEGREMLIVPLTGQGRRRSAVVPPWFDKTVDPSRVSEIEEPAPRMATG